MPMVENKLKEVDRSNTKCIAETRDHNDIAYEDEDVVVFIDQDGTELYETAKAHGIDRSELLKHMRNMTPASVEANWNASTPFVVKK